MCRDKLNSRVSIKFMKQILNMIGRSDALFKDDLKRFEPKLKKSQKRVIDSAIKVLEDINSYSKQ